MVGLGVPTLIFAAIAAVPAVHSVIQWLQARATAEERWVLGIMEDNGGIIFHKPREQGDEGSRVFINTQENEYHVGVIFEHLELKALIAFSGTRMINFTQSIGGRYVSSAYVVEVYKLTPGGRLAALGVSLNEAKAFMEVRKLTRQP
jgi:hypothetical protein